MSLNSQGAFATVAPLVGLSPRRREGSPGTVVDDSLSVPEPPQGHFREYDVDREKVDQLIAQAGLTKVNARVDDATGCFVVTVAKATD